MTGLHIISRQSSCQRQSITISNAIFACLLLTGVFSPPATAVQPYTPVQSDPVLEAWRWTRFPELNGLGLRCLTGDREGNMWFGVNEGVVRYDGINWTTFTEKDGLYGAPVNELLSVRDGSVYAGTDLGISRFADGKWQRFFPSKGDLPWPVNSLMEAKDGSVWVGTPRGALRLNRGEARLYTTEETGRHLQRLKADVTVSIVPDTAAAALPWPTTGMTLVGGKVIAAAAGGPAEKAGLEVRDMIVAVDGQSRSIGDWLNGPAGTQVRVTAHRAGRTFEATIVREAVGKRRAFGVWGIYEDRDSAMWFGLSNGRIGGGIVRFDIRGAQTNEATAWRRYTEADGLEIGLGPEIVQTRDGVIWTISEENYRGVNRFDGKTWTHLRLASGIHASILETRDGTLWVGGDGLLAYRNGEWQRYGNQVAGVEGLSIGNRTQLFEASDGALWAAGLGQEAARLDLNTSRWTVYKGLWFRCETPDGSAWFVSEDNGVVRYDGKSWLRYGLEDGLMDAPWGLLATRQGEVWAFGSHDSTSATARFNGTTWERQVFPQLSWGINVGIESLDGHLYFGGQINYFPERGHAGGMVRFDPSPRLRSGQALSSEQAAWTHLTPPEAPGSAYGMAQTSDGRLWTTGFGIKTFDGQQWTFLEEPEELTLQGSVTGPVVAQGQTLWVGTRNYGVFYYDGLAWRSYDVRDGLANNNVLDMLIAKDGSVWASMAQGISRFDGRTWTTFALPQGLRGWLKQSQDGAIWINPMGAWGGRARPGTAPQKDYGLRTVRYQPDAVPPQTEITVSVEEVSQPGNTTLSWKGIDPWKATSDEEIQFSHRMNQRDWSPFSHKTSEVFFSLSPGTYTFEVRARDRDFNIDPTPASVIFTVVPPVWQEPWFIAMVVLFAGAVSIQTTRVIRRDRRLHITNDALSSANKDLFKVNIDLQQKTEDLEAANIQIQEQTERKSAFLASMSHELRTPMNAIKGFTNLVLRRAGDLLPDPKTCKKSSRRPITSWR